MAGLAAKALVDLHGADRMIEIVASTLGSEHYLSDDTLSAIRYEVFLAILDEERDAGLCRPSLVDALRKEVEAEQAAKASA